MNLNFRRRDRRHQEMDFSLPASLFLLSVVFWQFVSAADQNHSPIKAEPGQNVFLPCEDPGQGAIIVVEWSRTDLESGLFVLLYRDGKIDLGNQHPSYRDRMDLLIGQIQKGDASVVLKNTTIADSGTYECRVKQTNREKKLISTVSLVVAPPPPEPFPVWATVLLVLLGLALVVAASVSFYFWLRWKPDSEQAVMESGEKSVLLPFKVPRCLWFIKYRIFLHVDKVEWKDGYKRTVHVYQNGSDQPGQNQIYRTRTEMDKNLLKNGDFSLTLIWPKESDNYIFTCRVYNKNGKVLMMKDVWLMVKVPEQVVVEPGKESVLLPWTIREDLGGVVKVEWKDGENKTVHVYQNGSDQPVEQNQIYKDRTKMDENLLENKNLSLTLMKPTDEDTGIYTCIVNSDGVVLMEKHVLLQVKDPQVEVESGEESVLLPWEITEDLDGVFRVEWMDKYNRMVHVYQNGSDQPGEQNEIYRTRTKMDENLMKNKDLTLTLLSPTERDTGIYTCRVYNRVGVVLMKKQINLQVKVQQVVVESGVESVLLPWRITENLGGDVKVEWKDRENRTVHVYQNGSDQPVEQNQIYRNRTKMDENLLKNKNLSLTLMKPTDEDRGKYTCRVYNRDGVLLVKKEVLLWVKGTLRVQPEDTRTRRNSIDLSPLMGDQSV